MCRPATRRATRRRPEGREHRLLPGRQIEHDHDLPGGAAIGDIAVERETRAVRRPCDARGVGGDLTGGLFIALRAHDLDATCLVYKGNRVSVGRPRQRRDRFGSRVVEHELAYVRAICPDGGEEACRGLARGALVRMRGALPRDDEPLPIGRPRGRRGIAKHEPPVATVGVERVHGEVLVAPTRYCEGLPVGDHAGSLISFAPGSSRTEPPTGSISRIPSSAKTAIRPFRGGSEAVAVVPDGNASTGSVMRRASQAFTPLRVTPACHIHVTISRR